VRPFRHFTPRYLWDRLRLERERRRNPFTPMIEGGIIALLQDFIRPDYRGLEAGAGASTVWFAERCAHLISIEHDALWAARVQESLAKRGLAQRVDLRLCSKTLRGASLAYVGTIENQPDQSLDFVLIDGKRRDACALAAVSKVRPGGLLVVDDIHRYIAAEQPSRTPYARKTNNAFASPRWEEFYEATRHWQCIRRSNGIYETALWIKPRGDAHSVAN
jgi:predicted O-methyltransferase YrrM